MRVAGDACRAAARGAVVARTIVAAVLVPIDEQRAVTATPWSARFDARFGTVVCAIAEFVVVKRGRGRSVGVAPQTRGTRRSACESVRPGPASSPGERVCGVQLPSVVPWSTS